jgi:hypothetical protein
MVHDPDLLDRLSAFTPIRFDDRVYRTTRLGLKPLTGSLAGGRWAPRDLTPVLYTCLAADGAMAEIVFQLTQLDPRPSKPVQLHEISLTAHSTIRLLRADLTQLGVKTDAYTSINYERTQQIGAAVAFLGCDGVLAPSARWNCENLMLFLESHTMGERLELIKSETVDWQDWERRHAKP